MFDLKLEGKMAIITGGSDGLGRASAHTMAMEGAKVAICSRREDHLDSAVKNLTGELGKDILGVRADVCNPEDCTNLIKKTRES